MTTLIKITNKSDATIKPRIFRKEDEVYEKLLYLRENIINAFAIEEKYLLFIENYICLEKELFSFSNHFLYYSNIILDEKINMIREFNRLLINLVASFTAYIDQVNHHLKEIDKTTNSILELAEKYATQKSEIYDKSVEYRFICQLRNYIQHGGMPTHRIGMSYSLNEHGDTSTFSPTITTFKSILSQNKKFKKTVLNEITKTYGEEISIIPILLKFMSAFSSIHKNVRDLIFENHDLIFPYKEITEIAGFFQATNSHNTEIIVIHPNPGKKEYIIPHELYHQLLHLSKRVNCITSTQRKIDIYK